ncbi:5-deoxy-glucuronate isomerase [Streptomyces nodosus]|uniref:5-deoxy-glucuronate isomerase n=1 Tax=Streptomyces nodosus TaxID=40318 RepID=A0A0B5DRM9_9ACTN|nr:5-deoxy-glucuronate isomerase [Streptomyces nodosus]AJE43246.1 5-deoxyglucuronate isomerase [Streptomyces nodosus]MBB4794671.1 5-deoxy-glucuronate isomerase [Streptomyces nodosus]QEV41746.1 5-deoxy-glucuronate isomerase [Streptomyces nodosus]
MTATHHLPAGRAATDAYAVEITPESAGWGYSGLKVLDLPSGGRHTFDTADSEWIVLPLSGSCTVTVDDDTFRLHGRESVFSGVSDFAYVPRDARVSLTSEAGGRFALTGARCERRLPARYGPASAVPVELRGTGNCSRQVNNFAAAAPAGAGDGYGFDCDRLIAVEVITPGGNWSSFPPHKHDEHRPGEESQLEEIYYFEFAAHEGTPGLGYQRVSPSGPGRTTDVLAEVRDGDVVLIPDGWHGPSMAVPGHHMYYLNVMAGPDPERAWLICDHPGHAWIRGTWPAQPADPRLPLYTAPADEPSQ